MTPEAPTAQRGKCPKCGREFQIKQDGTIFHHGGAPGTGWPGLRRAYRCAGAGLPAVDLGAGLEGS